MQTATRHRSYRLPPIDRCHEPAQSYLARFAALRSLIRLPGEQPCLPCGTRAACEASLKRLGVDAIDLYYQHRVDSKVDITESVGELKVPAPCAPPVTAPKDLASDMPVH